MDQPIEVDNQDTAANHVDNDDVKEENFGNSSESGLRSISEKSLNSTKSLTGSVLEQHFVEHGRRYCNESYYMPNDEVEQTRLAIAHQTFSLVLDGQLCMTRIPKDVERILDIGAGTGDWAIAIGERFPYAEVVATDITVLEPTGVPPNVFFEFDDARKEWTYTEQFDYIHLRGLTGGFSDWSTVYSEAHIHLRPGGSLEVADFGMIALNKNLPNSYVSIFNGACLSAAEKAGVTIALEHMKKPLLQSAGLSVTKSKVFEVPLGTWSLDPKKKVVGKMALISALEGLEACSLRLLTKELGWSEEDVKDLCAKVQEEVMRPDVCAFMPCQFIIARKLLM